jgi:cytochrome c556
MKTSIRIPALLILAFLCACGAARASETATNSTSAFMRQKLTYSQSILEGLTLEKFDLIRTNATLMRNMTFTNTFVVLQNPDYLERVKSFQGSVDSLIDAAGRENVDAATAAFTRVTRNCVDCHKYFRREQRFRDTAPATGN